ncbi:sarcoma antigen ny-sar-95-related [Anaeramoeba flamelloides]|uniref:Sarcoma antigen ny-sar-95-related n=1 Tax=Anaeramoeba flamelloides TaxID=1746091 RepID=A0ABQ8XSU1_9EUKA|nr:sarcoma antigen ny-sar-95-related [Anaeramoeba flamelloides]
MNFRRTAFIVDFCNTKHFTNSSKELESFGVNNNQIYNSIRKHYVESTLEYSRLAFDLFPNTSELSIFVTGKPTVRLNNYSRNEQDILKITEGFLQTKSFNDKTQFSLVIEKTIKKAIYSLSEKVSNYSSSQNMNFNCSIKKKKHNFFRCILLLNRRNEFHSIDHEWVLECVSKINEKSLKNNLKGKSFQREREREREREKQREKKSGLKKRNIGLLIKHLEFVVLWTDFAFDLQREGQQTGVDLINDKIYSRDGSVRITEYLVPTIKIVNVVNDLATYQMRLAAYQIHNIPMKDNQQNQLFRVKHDVYLLVHDLHQSVKKELPKESEKSKTQVYIPGYLKYLSTNNQELTWKRGYKTNDILGMAIKNTLRATPLNVSASPTVCLIKYVMHGKAVILNNLSSNQNILLSGKNGILYLSKVYKDNGNIKRPNRKLNLSIGFPTFPIQDLPDNALINTSVEQWKNADYHRYLALYLQLKKIITSNLWENKSEINDLKFLKIQLSNIVKKGVKRDFSKMVGSGGEGEYERLQRGVVEIEENGRGITQVKNENYHFQDKNNFLKDNVNSSNTPISNQMDNKNSVKVEIKQSLINRQKNAFATSSIDNETYTIENIERKTCHLDLDFNIYSEFRNNLQYQTLQIKEIMENINPTNRQINNSISSLTRLYEQKYDTNYLTLWTEMYKFFQRFQKSKKHEKVENAFLNLFKQVQDQNPKHEINKLRSSLKIKVINNNGKIDNKFFFEKKRRLNLFELSQHMNLK